MSTNETVAIDNGEQKPMSYREAIQYLSEMDFMTDQLIDGSVCATHPDNIGPLVPLIVAIYRKSEYTVIEDLIEKRRQEDEEVRSDNELRYGHLNQDGSDPNDP